MDIVQIINSVDKTSKRGMVKFVAESGSNTCRECSDNDGRIFNIDDPDLPHLPVHPYCRCKYVAADDPKHDVTAEVEEHGISANLVRLHRLPEAEASALAKQVTTARTENRTIRRQKLFLLFNGRYLMSSDGKFLASATAGQPTSIEEVKRSVTPLGCVTFVRKFKFDNSYQHQAEENNGPLPRGLYYIDRKESGSLVNGNLIKHLLRRSSWGNYHWRLTPSIHTDMRGRRANSFTIHGGEEPGSAGCIDLNMGDGKFKSYLDTLNMNVICVYAQYPDQEVTMEYKTEFPPKFAFPLD